MRRSSPHYEGESFAMDTLTIATPEDAQAWLTALESEGLFWHPEDDAHDLVNGSGRTFSGCTEWDYQAAAHPTTCEACAFQDTMNSCIDLIGIDAACMVGLDGLAV